MENKLRKCDILHPLNDNSNQHSHNQMRDARKKETRT